MNHRDAERLSSKERSLVRHSVESKRRLVTTEVCCSSRVINCYKKTKEVNDHSWYVVRIGEFILSTWGVELENKT